jgi:hypothetical protein
MRHDLIPMVLLTPKPDPMRTCGMSGGRLGAGLATQSSFLIWPREESVKADGQPDFPLDFLFCSRFIPAISACQPVGWTKLDGSPIIPGDREQQ